MYKGEDATATVEDRDCEQAEDDDAQTSDVEEEKKVGEANDADRVEIVEHDPRATQVMHGNELVTSAPQNDANTDGTHVVETAVEQRDVPEIEMN